MRSQLSIALLLLSPLAQARDLAVVEVTSSSEHSDDSGVSYAPKNVKDRKQSTAWFEGEDGSGLGAWIQLDLGQSQSVTGLRVWNGYWLNDDMWQRNNRVKDLEVELSDGSKHSFSLQDTRAIEELRFPKAVTTQTVKLRIKGIHRGNTFNDTALSEVQLFDGASSEVVVPASFSASSTYPEDSDGSYGPGNVGDGLLDSMWCEGSADGDGTGEWIQLDLGGSSKVGGLVLSNGNALDLKSFMSANSAVKGTVSFSDGSKEVLTIKPSMMEQTIRFASPRTTSSLRLSFDEVRKGKEFNDLCISELRVVP